MALAELSFASPAMHRPMPVTLLLPDREPPQGVLYLLHGFSDCHATIVRNSALARYCESVPVLVVMPEAGCSFYADSPAGQYWQYISQELPTRIEQWFSLPRERARRFVGGISMGGYGAAKWALQQPERFGQAFLLAPVTDLPKVCAQGFDRSLDPNAPTREALQLDKLFPEPVAGTDRDLYALLEKADPGALPDFSVYAGNEDFLLADIRRFVGTLEKKVGQVPFATAPGYHGWETWEGFLQDMCKQIAQRLAE